MRAKERAMARMKLEMSEQAISEQAIANPGTELDELGVTCEMLFDRFRRTGNHSGMDGMWNALQEFSAMIDKIDSQVSEHFGEEM